MDSIIMQILDLFGITQVPTTVQEFLWVVIVLFVGLWCVKWICIFVFGLMKQMMRL